MTTAARERAAPARQGRRPRSETQMTSRGVGVLAAGVVIAALGVGLSTPILVYIGVAMTCAVAVAWIWLILAVDAFLRVIPATRREVSPHPLTAGSPGTVSVTIDSRSAGRHARLRRSVTEHLDLREQAAAELTGGVSTKATVSRGDGTLTLRYSLQPLRRGRWPLGPALVHSGDPFGMIHADTPVGEPQFVPVWPAVVDLSGTAGALMGHADRVVLGARTPSPDDASLRAYQDGDDLRRVHWASTARLGTMLVRSDERAGRRPATVILDPPRDPVALEWAISAAASIALSVLDSGHPVRLIGGGLDAESVRHLGERGGEAARYELLNQTIDLHAPASRTDATTQLIRSAALAAEDARQGEVTVAVIEPLAQQALDALVPLGETGRAWAIVRTGPSTEAEAGHTVRGLRRAGWRATVASSTDDLTELWSRMLTAGDIG